MSKKEINIFAGVLIAFFLIKFIGPLIFVHLGLAQSLIKSPSPSSIPLDQFYLGQSEVYFGILTQLFSGIMFALFCLRFLKDCSAQTFGWAVFTYLILTKCETLFFPPYGDPISGPWVEAVWLARHNFDFMGLSAQPGYLMGGAKVYLFSIYPAFLAILMKLIPSVKLFLLVNHVLTFAMCAVIVVIARQIGNKYFSKDIALLSALLVMVLPLFQSMGEGINMEIPSLFFVMLTVWALFKRQFGWATLYAVLGILVKGSGMIACWAVFMVAGIDWRLGTAPLRDFRRNMLWGCVALGWTIIQVFLKYAIHDQHTVNDMGILRGLTAVVSGYSFKIFAISVFLCTVLFLVRTQGKNLWGAFKTVWAKYDLAVIVFLMTLNWMILFINFAGHSPRYDIILCGLLPFIVVFSISRIIQGTKELVVFLMIALATILFSSYGTFIPNHPKDSSYYEYLILYRSLEYRNDIQMYMRVAHELEKNFSGFTIGAPFIMVHALAIKELGYVTKPLNAMSYATTVTYEGIKPFEGLEHLNIKNTVWVGFKGHLNQAVAQIVKDFPIDPQKDLVLKQVGFGDRYATLFMGGAAIDMSQKLILYLMQKNALQQNR